MSGSGCQSSYEEAQPANHGYVLPEGKIIPNTVFVGGIDVRMDEIEIKEYFSRFGDVKEVKIITDRTGISKGYGFVSYYEDVDVQQIVDSQISFHGKKLKLGPAIRKQNMCTYIQPRPIIISNPMPHYPNMWNTNVPDPYVHHPPVFSPVTQYVQAFPYSGTTAPVMYHQMPLGCQQPGYYQVSPQWPNGDQRNFVFPQPFSWTYHGIEMEMSSNSNEMLLPETYIQEQIMSPVPTSPQKGRMCQNLRSLDRSDQPSTKPTRQMDRHRLESSQLTQQEQSPLPGQKGRGAQWIKSANQDKKDYLRWCRHDGLLETLPDRRMHQFRRSRPFMKPTFDKAGV